MSILREHAPFYFSHTLVKPVCMTYSVSLANTSAHCVLGTLLGTCDKQIHKVTLVHTTYMWEYRPNTNTSNMMKNRSH
jgi:hypothetical protein